MGLMIKSKTRFACNSEGKASLKGGIKMKRIFNGFFFKPAYIITLIFVLSRILNKKNDK